MLLGPLSLAFGSLADVRIPRGAIELPFAYGEHVWGLMKGRPTKYIKRVPKPGGGFRYYYQAGHGGGVHAHEHMVEGARFRHGDGHFQIHKVDGDKLHVRHTGTGAEHVTTKHELAGKLEAEHAAGLKAYRDRAVKALAEAKANKASPKQVAKLEERVRRAGAKSEEKHEDAVLSEVPEYQRRAYRGDTAKDLRAKAASVRDMAKRAKERNQGGPSYSINDGIQDRIDAEKRRHAAEAAEYEANASFLERLADAKDKDAGVGTKPEPTIGGRKASEARVRTADEKSDDYAKDLRDVLARHSAHPDVQEDAKLFFGAATASGSSGRAMPTIDDKHKARPTEKKYPALSRAPAALREEIARLAGAAHREHAKELEDKSTRWSEPKPKPEPTIGGRKASEAKRESKVYLTEQAQSVISQLGKKDHYRHSSRDMDEIKAIKGAIKNGQLDVSGMDPKDADALAWNLQRKGEHMISSNRNEAVGRQIIRVAKAIRGEADT